jgi:RHS repeat-associated protein
MGGPQYEHGSRLEIIGARYYDPDLGRFLSEDPIGISGGLNLYAYAGNDPVNKADPTGTSEQCGYAWFEWTYRWIDGPHKGEISRTEYHQQWVCDPVADGPSSEPSEYPAKGGRKPGQEDGKFEGFGGRPRTWDQRLATCANRELLSSGDATAVTVAVGPWVPKQALGQPVLPGASPFTNLVSEARFPAKALGMDTRLSSRALGSNNLFGAAGRFGNYAAVGLLVYQASEVVACMDAGDMAAGGGYSGSGAGGEF